MSRVLGPPTGRALLPLGAVMLMVLLGLGCAETEAPTPVRRLSDQQRDLLVSPLRGYPLSISDEIADAVEQAHWDLLAAVDPSVVVAVAQQALASEPPCHPAELLLAQVDLVAGRPTLARDRLLPLVAEVPGYLAAELAVARAHDELGEAMEAYGIFRRFALRDSRASQRARALEPRAIETVESRFDEALDRGRLDDAEAELGLLASWLGDDEPRVLDARRRIHLASGDEEGELEVLRRLVVLDPSSELRGRLAKLEIDHGDVRAGLELFEILSGETPDDPSIAEGLERAKFFWRLELQPLEVQQLARQGELSRADFAVLVYWLVPTVRTAPVRNPTIANDILDHRFRDEIVRVLNQGLMKVDETVHRFAPDRPMTRVAALASLLTLLERSVPPPACLVPGEIATLRRSTGALCRKAADCRLLDEAAECLPSAALSGVEALELFRRNLKGLATGPG